MHEADLRLRQAVKEELQHGGRSAKVSAALAGAKREALAALRHVGQQRPGGAVPWKAFEAAVQKLRKAAEA